MKRLARKVGKTVDQLQTSKELDLGEKSLNDADGPALAILLRVNAVLTVLRLDGNKISDAGASALGDALRVNGVLTTLNLYGNNINENGKEQLREAVQGREGFDLRI